jgi:cytosine/adenosine deaminase-related metal-dependent hydrolase
MSGDGRRNAASRSLVVAALASGHTYAAAAVAGNVSERTVRRWMTEDAFQREVRELTAETLTRTARRLCNLADKAITTLDALLESSDARVRLGAARLTLEAGPRLQEVADFDARLIELERYAVTES